jgi:hypothetical protein
VDDLLDVGLFEREVDEARALRDLRLDDRGDRGSVRRLPWAEAKLELEPTAVRVRAKHAHVDRSVVAFTDDDVCELAQEGSERRGQLVFA